MRRSAPALAALVFLAVVASPAPAMAEGSDPQGTTVGATPARFPDWICRIAPRLCA